MSAMTRRTFLKTAGVASLAAALAACTDEPASRPNAPSSSEPTYWPEEPSSSSSSISSSSISSSSISSQPPAPIVENYTIGYKDKLRWVKVDGKEYIIQLIEVEAIKPELVQEGEEKENIYWAYHVLGDSRSIRIGSQSGNIKPDYVSTCFGLPSGTTVQNLGSNYYGEEDRYITGCAQGTKTKYYAFAYSVEWFEKYDHISVRLYKQGDDAAAAIKWKIYETDVKSLTPITATSAAFFVQ